MVSSLHFVVTLPNSLVVTVTGGSLRAHSHAGEPLWFFQLPADDETTCAPAASRNSSLYVRGFEAIYAISPEGLLLWQVEHQDADSEMGSIVAMTDSGVAMTAGDISLIAYDHAGNHRWTWSLPTGERIVAEPHTAESGAIFVMGNARTYSVSPAGKLNWSV